MIVIDELLHQIQTVAQARLAENKMADVNTLETYYHTIQVWHQAGQVGPLPVTAEALTRFGVSVPPQWISLEPVEIEIDGPITTALQPLDLSPKSLDMYRAVEFPHLSAAAFQHPLDVQATRNIARIPLLSQLMKKLSGTFFERQVWRANISGSVRLGPHQAGTVYQKFVRAAQILDVQKLPEVFVSSEGILNATAFGMENYQITLYRDLLDFLTEDELMAVIGHELGHVKCQHMLYKTLAYILRFFGVEVLNMMMPAGTGALASIPLQLAILHWERMAEFSCDRAALLVVQDPEVVASALTKLAGGSQRILPELNLDSVLEQAQLYDDGNDSLLEKIAKIQLMLFQTHPMPIVRVQKIMEWAESDEYRSILNGDYIQDAFPPVISFPDPVATKCGACQHWNPANAAFCIDCGANLRDQAQICTNCELELKPKWRICPGCGANLVETEDGQVVHGT